MKNFLERITFLGHLARRRREKRLEEKYIKWQSKGSVLPMPHFGKQKVVEEYAKKFTLPVFVETGTYKGDMVYAVLNRFEQIFSIELERTLFEQAKKRFSGYKHVHVMNGQSGVILPEILDQLRRPCLFWLDAHWSGGATAKGDLETPIIEELQTIFDHPHAEEHVLLIDDARCFTGENDYPTLDGLKAFVISRHPDWVFEVADDIIRLHANSLSDESG